MQRPTNAAMNISRMYKPRAEHSTPPLGTDSVVEVKCRAAGFAQSYCWPDERDTLFVKADRQEPSVVLRMSLAADIAKATPGTADTAKEAAQIRQADAERG